MVLIFTLSVMEKISGVILAKIYNPETSFLSGSLVLEIPSSAPAGILKQSTNCFLSKASTQ